MKAARVAYVLTFGLLLQGCATILGGTSQTITVNSNIDGAEVFFNDTRLGVTPLTANLDRGQEGLMRVTAEGYQPYQIAMNKKVSTLFWVNIFSGGVFGSTTDYLTGAMYEYEPSTFMVTLQPSDLSEEELKAWQKQEHLRAFVLLNDEALVSDLATGEGEYIAVLVDVLSVPSTQREAAIARWREAYGESVTAVEFAEKIVSEAPH